MREGDKEERRKEREKRIEYAIHHSTATEINLGTMPVSSSYVTRIEYLKQSLWKLVQQFLQPSISLQQHVSWLCGVKLHTRGERGETQYACLS